MLENIFLYRYFISSIFIFFYIFFYFLFLVETSEFFEKKNEIKKYILHNFSFFFKSFFYMAIKNYYLEKKEVKISVSSNKHEYACTAIFIFTTLFALFFLGGFETAKSIPFNDAMTVGFIVGFAGKTSLSYRRMVYIHKRGMGTSTKLISILSTCGSCSIFAGSGCSLFYFENYQINIPGNLARYAGGNMSYIDLKESIFSPASYQVKQIEIARLNAEIKALKMSELIDNSLIKYRKKHRAEDIEDLDAIVRTYLRKGPEETDL